MEIISPKEEKEPVNLPSSEKSPNQPLSLAPLTCEDYQSAPCQKYPGGCHHCWPGDSVWSGGEELCGRTTQLLH